VVQSICLSEY